MRTALQSFDRRGGRGICFYVAFNKKARQLKGFAALRPMST